MGWNKGNEGEKRHQNAKTVSRVRRKCTNHGEAGSLEAVRRVEVEDTGGEWPSDTRILADSHPTHPNHDDAPQTLHAGADSGTTRRCFAISDGFPGIFERDLHGHVLIVVDELVFVPLLSDFHKDTFTESFPTHHVNPTPGRFIRNLSIKDTY